MISEPISAKENAMLQQTGNKFEVSTSDLQFAARCVADAIRTVLEEFGSDPEWRGRSGCYFCLASENRLLVPAQPMICLVEPIGPIPSDKALKYFGLCQEKAIRLAEQRELHGHHSSYQSRVPEQGKYGGAICVDRMIWSCSGFSDQGDEMVMLLAARYFLIGSPNQISAVSRCQLIAKLSSNPYWDRFASQFTAEAFDIRSSTNT